MHRCQGPTGNRIMHSRQPTSQLWRRVVDVQLQYFEEKKLSQPDRQSSCMRVLAVRCIKRILDAGRDPGGFRPGRRSDAEKCRQRAHDRVEDRIVTVQVAADNARAASATAVADDWKLLPRRDWQERCDR